MKSMKQSKYHEWLMAGNAEWTCYSVSASRYGEDFEPCNDTDYSSESQGRGHRPSPDFIAKIYTKSTIFIRKPRNASEHSIRLTYYLYPETAAKLHGIIAIRNNYHDLDLTCYPLHSIRGGGRRVQADGELFECGSYPDSGRVVCYEPEMDKF